MRWPDPILTDSGGFQVMSLAQLRKLDEKGVTFRSHIDGSQHELTPERSIEIQGLLGSDIQMQLDECVALRPSREDIGPARHGAVAALGRALQGRVRRQPGKAMFGIVQGGDQPDLRADSAEALAGDGPQGLSRSAGSPSASRRT